MLFNSVTDVCLFLHSTTQADSSFLSFFFTPTLQLDLIEEGTQSLYSTENSLCMYFTSEISVELKWPATLRLFVEPSIQHQQNNKTRQFNTLAKPCNDRRQWTLGRQKIWWSLLHKRIFLQAGARWERWAGNGRMRHAIEPLAIPVAIWFLCNRIAVPGQVTCPLQPRALCDVHTHTVALIYVSCKTVSLAFHTTVAFISNGFVCENAFRLVKLKPAGQIAPARRSAIRAATRAMANTRTWC